MSTWTPILSGKNYPVASVQCLRDLERHCEGDDRNRRLTDRCYWSQPQGSNPFKPCNHKSRTGCNQLQHVVAANPTRPLELKVNGAVVFEAARSLARMRCRRPVMAKSDDSFEDILSSSEKISDDVSNSPQTRHSGPTSPHTTHDLSRSMFHNSNPPITIFHIIFATTYLLRTTGVVVHIIPAFAILMFPYHGGF